MSMTGEAMQRIRGLEKQISQYKKRIAAAHIAFDSLIHQPFINSLFHHAVSTGDKLDMVPICITDDNTYAGKCGQKIVCAPDDGRIWRSGLISPDVMLPRAYIHIHVHDMTDVPRDQDMSLNIKVRGDKMMILICGIESARDLPTNIDIRVDNKDAVYIMVCTRDADVVAEIAERTYIRLSNPDGSIMGPVSAFARDFTYHLRDGIEDVIRLVPKHWLAGADFVKSCATFRDIIQRELLRQSR